MILNCISSLFFCGEASMLSFPQLFANESVSEHVGFARVFIDLINENDNRPIFSKPLYNISLPENTPTGTTLLQVLVSLPIGGFMCLEFLIWT